MQAFDPNTVREQAEKEYQEELFRAAVERYKQRLRERKSLWDKIFPWKILIVRKHARH